MGLSCARFYKRFVKYFIGHTLRVCVMVLTKLGPTHLGKLGLFVSPFHNTLCFIFFMSLSIVTAFYCDDITVNTVNRPILVLEMFLFTLCLFVRYIPHIRVVRHWPHFISVWNIGLASTYPEPEDKRKWLENQLYNYNYENSLPETWKWPEPEKMKTRGFEPTKLH